jgi:hypothetical protein
MRIKWKTFITQVAVWILLEILLNLLGLDSLADYGEFLSHKFSTPLVNSLTIAAIA